MAIAGERDTLRRASLEFFEARLRPEVRTLGAGRCRCRGSDYGGKEDEAEAGEAGTGVPDKNNILPLSLLK